MPAAAPLSWARGRVGDGFAYDDLGARACALSAEPDGLLSDVPDGV